MPILSAQVRTDRAGRYLSQFCRHAAAMGDGDHAFRMRLHAGTAGRTVQVTAECSENGGTVTFGPWGRCILAADGDTLTLRIESTDEDGLGRIRDVVDRDLERFSRRDPVTLSWEPPDTPGPDAVPTGRTPTPPPRRGRPRTHRRTILLALVAVLAIALHMGLAGTAVADSRWAGGPVGILVALLVAKIALLGWVRRRRRRAVVATGRTRGPRP